MLVDCTLHPEHATQYHVLDASTGVEIPNCVAACEEEGWTLTVHPDQRYPCRAFGPACQLEFRPVRIESVASTPCPVKYYQVGDSVRIRSASSSELGAVVSRYNGQVGIVEDVWDPGPNLFLNVRVGDDVVFCSPADLELVARKLQNTQYAVGDTVIVRDVGMEYDSMAGTVQRTLPVGVDGVRWYDVRIPVPRTGQVTVRYPADHLEPAAEIAFGGHDAWDSVATFAVGVTSVAHEEMGSNFDRTASCGGSTYVETALQDFAQDGTRIK